MPSIPQSLLWISLVVLWLFVLVPMLISKRDAVRRTSDVALATRVLNSGAGARLRRRGGPAAGHRSDPDWQPSADAGSADHEADLEAGLDADPEVGRSVVMVATADDEVGDEPDYLDVDVVEDSGALPISDLTDRPAGDIADETAEKPVRAAAASAPESARGESGVDETDQPTLDFEGSRERSRVRAASAAERDTSEDTGVYSVIDDEYEYVDDSSGIEPPADEPGLRVADSLTDARRRRRESTTADAVSARKYRFRARTIAVLSVLMLASAVAAFTWSTSMWYVTALVSGLTLLYLAYLRRQTRIEEQLRRRRAARLARSRLGVENTSDREYDVTPARLRRPGAAVLEIDDEDPEFEHLEYVAFSRRYTMSGDLPRAAGQ